MTTSECLWLAYAFTSLGAISYLYGVTQSLKGQASSARIAHEALRRAVIILIEERAKR